MSGNDRRSIEGMLRGLATLWVLGTPFLFIFTVTFGLGLGDTDLGNMPLVIAFGTAMYMVGIGTPLTGLCISIFAGRYMPAGLFTVALIMALFAAWRIRLFPFNY
ncbi:hypothetical protein ACWDRB_43485 [Nonomuraea sp. NPDC003707]